MSCNHCSTASTAPASAAGAPDIEAGWAGHRSQPQFCPDCHAFLRADGGCTKCEKEQVRPDRTDWTALDLADLQEATAPDRVERMAADSAGAALNRIMAFEGSARHIEPANIAALYARADLARLDPQQTGDFYRDTLDRANAKARRTLTASVISNPSAPAPALRLAAEEIAFGPTRRKDIRAVADHPQLDIEGQRTLTHSPNLAVRQAVAASSHTAEAVLDELVSDRDEKTALISLRNENSPHHPQLQAGRTAAIPDLETLHTIRSRQHSWRDLPRCGQCGAWTSQDGVCRNRHCGGFGRQMTDPSEERLRQPNLGQTVPAPLLRRLNKNFRSRIRAGRLRDEWDEARQRGTFPQSWREALPTAISTLAATGHWDTPDGRLIAWDDTAGLYCLDGIPVAANSAGEAVKTHLAHLAGEGVDAWRFSPAHDALVPANQPEPDLSFLEDGKALDRSPSPAAPPPATLPGGWERTRTLRKVIIYDTKDRKSETRLIVHRPDSEHHVTLRPDDDFQTTGDHLRRTLKSLAPITRSANLGSAYRQVWGLPPEANHQPDLDAPNGVWLATDASRLMVIAHDPNGEPIPDSLNANPNLAPLIDPDAPVRMGQAGLAFTGPDGHSLEAESDPGALPDINQHFPQGDPQFTFQITGVAPNELLKKCNPKRAWLEAENGEVFMTLLGPDRETVGRVKVGQSDNRVVSGRLRGINPQFFNEAAQTRPAAGQWQMEIYDEREPMALKHSSRQALGLIMPMWISHQ